MCPPWLTCPEAPDDRAGTTPVGAGQGPDEIARHPAAGGHRGGGRAREKELLADEKERAEHVMLVDLGRNDLGRVCRSAACACPS